jgi:hypothetical protein
MTMKTFAPAFASVFAPVVAVALLFAGPAASTNSPIELKTALQNIMTHLPGEYDNEPQRFFEAEYKTPKEQQHQRVYRAFTKIDAPDVGENVIVATVHASDKYSKFDEAEFQVWTLTVDSARQAVRMSPRKFKDPAKYAPIATDAAKLKGLAASELIPAKGAAGCDILWRVHGSQWLGRTDPGTCATYLTRRQTNASFDWEWLLNDQELWITFAGRDPAGTLVMGRADQTHWRLSKARNFECFLAYRPKGGEEQVKNGFIMHDRGDVHRFELKDAKGKPKPVFMELIRGTWPSNSGRNYLVLLRLQAYEGTPDAAPDTWKLIGNATGNDDTDRAGFTTQDLSGRCKLAKGTVANPI